MDFRYAVSLVLEAHLPFVREFSGENDLSQSGKEGWFFEAVSETYLPLLAVLDRLDNDRIPFRLGLAFSPMLCQMLNDEHLMKKYLFYTDKQIEFGRRELERTAGQADFNKMAELQYNRMLENRIAFAERYGGNILKAFDRFRRKGKIEILAGSATHAFLPFISHNPESMQAQMEVPISGYRRFFGGSPQGFYLPEFGWTSALEPFLRAYNFSYTIVDSHGLLFGKPLPRKGSFYPVKTTNGTFILARDFYAVREIEQIASNEVYRDNGRDAGYELSSEIVNPFLSAEGERRGTGFKYWPLSGRGQNTAYNPQAASDKVTEHARAFLENTTNRLEEAAKYMEEPPLSLYAHNADLFGRFWYEGPQFIEALFRMAAGYRDLQFLCPGEYIYKQQLSSFQVVTPEFSSWGSNGYAETWLDAGNDWVYRHLARSMERMTELAERFPDDTGLKERTLNQAAREILLAQSSDWPGLLYKQDSTEYARNQAENALRNFTTIYEALGSNYISTEWLTNLERRHNFFPNINYRVFRRKK
jgi:1,4-alpha-glucan branching enzyme